MSGSLNRVLLIGNLTADPEVKRFDNGNSVTNFRMATNERWTDKTSGEKREETEYHSCAAYGPQGENIAQYVHKGSSVFVEGKKKTREVVKADGTKAYYTDVIVTTCTFLDKPGQGSEGGEARVPVGAGLRASRPMVEEDDDIPF